MKSIAISSWVRISANGAANLNFTKPPRPIPGYPKLHFPRLQTLAYKIAGTTGIMLKPMVVPAHMNLAKAYGDEMAFRRFSLWPVKSVANIEINPVISNEPLSDEFYNVSNHLLGDVANISYASTSMASSMYIHLNIERTRWYKFSKLELLGTQQHCFLPYLAHLPALKQLTYTIMNRDRLGMLMYDRIAPERLIKELKDHGLELLTIIDGEDAWGLGHMVGMVMVLAKSV